MREILQQGIGKHNAFSTYHPIIIFCYFAAVTGLTMSVASPGILALSFVEAWLYSLMLKGKKAVRFNVLITVSVILLTTALNTFFTHDGDTVLFYINANRITMEAFIFGIFSGAVIVTVILWFSCFNEIVNSEMIMYLFSRISSLLGLLISMIMRYIPLLKTRYDEISMGQKCMGWGETKGLVKKTRLIVKKVSILISWSLESSIESADAMASRGYGLKGRSSFHLYKFSGRDIGAGLVFTFLFCGIIGFNMMGDTGIQFYPELIFPQGKISTIAESVLFVIFAGMPAVIDVVEEYRWKKLELNS